MDITKTWNGNGKWEIEKLEIVVSVITTEKLEWAHLRAHRRKYSTTSLPGLFS